eukprot:gene18128-21663_t
MSLVMSKNQVVIGIWYDSNNDGVKDGENYFNGYPYEITGPGGFKAEGEAKDPPFIQDLSDADGEYCVTYKILHAVVPGRYGKEGNKICATLPTADGKPFNATISFTYESTPTDFQITLFFDPPGKGRTEKPWDPIPEEAEVSLVGEKSGEVFETVKTTSLAEFKNQPRGQYCVVVTPPDSLKITEYTYNNQMPESGRWCFGDVPDAREPVKMLNVGLTKAIPMFIKGFAWIDNNYNGVKEDGEELGGPYEATLTQEDTEIDNFKIEKKEDGFLRKIRAGNYCLTVTDAEEGKTPTKIGKDNLISPDTHQHCFTMPPADTKPNDDGKIEYEIKAGFTSTFDIKGYAWKDLNKDDKENEGDQKLVVDVEIKRDGEAVQTFKTKEEDGSFFAGLLPPGNYCITFKSKGLEPVKMSDEFSHIDSKGEKCFTLPTEDGEEVDIKAGFKDAAREQYVGLLLWIDNTNDGDLSPPVDKYYEGKFDIIDQETNKTVKAGLDSKKDRPSARTYLVPGKYCIKLDLPDMVPTFSGRDSPYQKDDERVCFEIEKDKDSQEVRLGFREAFTLGVHIFEDLNHDGEQDQNKEEDLAGIKVSFSKYDRVPTMIGDQVYMARGKNLSVFFEKETDSNGDIDVGKVDPVEICIKAVDPKGKMSVTVKGKDNVLEPDGTRCFFIPIRPADRYAPIPSRSVVKGGFENSYSLTIVNFDDVNKNGKDDDKKFYGPMRGQLTKDDKPPVVIKTFTVPASRTGFKLRSLVPGKYILKLSDPKNRYKPTQLGGDNMIDPANNKYSFEIGSDTVDKTGDLKIKGGWIPR